MVVEWHRVVHNSSPSATAAPVRIIRGSRVAGNPAAAPVGVALGTAVRRETRAGSLDVGPGGKLLVEMRPSAKVLAVNNAVPRLHTSQPLSSS
jgi:hypothetical protein